MNNDIEQALTLTLEIEGLLHLLQHRGLNNLPESVKHLLNDKITRLASMLAFDIDTKVQAAIENFESQSTLQETESVNDSQVTDGELLAETVEYEQEEDSEPKADSPYAYETKIDIAQAEEDEADTEAAEIEDARKDYYGEIMQKRVEGSKLMQRFTLNDRYRFVRELFGGSNTAFNTILEEISTFDSIDKVKEYLENKQGIDFTTQTGKAFLNIIGRQ